MTRKTRTKRPDPTIEPDLDPDLEAPIDDADWDAAAPAVPAHHHTGATRMTRDDRTASIKAIGKLARRRALLETKIGEIEDQIREIDREAVELSATLFPQARPQPVDAPSLADAA